MTELSATLAFSAIKGNDKVGLTLFTDGIEKFVPPRKGTRHVLRIIRELLYCEPMGQGTSLRKALEHLNRTASRRTVVFLVSDFQDSGLRTGAQNRPPQARYHPARGRRSAGIHDAAGRAGPAPRRRDWENDRARHVQPSESPGVRSSMRAARRRERDALFRKLAA